MLIKLFSIFISSVILSQSFNIHVNDILKLNDMIEHLEFHEEEYGDDLFTFFSKHYGVQKQEHHNNNHPEKHNQLPFNHQCQLDISTAFVLQKMKFTIIKYAQKTYASSLFFYQDSNSLFEKSNLFQPPKKALFI